MKTQTMLITPQQADEWLKAKNYQDNRKLRASVVDRYARDMESGKWTTTHQGIAFNTRGELIDGQHRLAAIAKSGVSITLTVSTDVPCASFAHVDLGFSRTAQDVLRAEGDEWVTKEIIAIARLVNANGDIRKSLVGLSPFELRELVYLHRNAITFVMHNMESRVRSVTVSPVLAAVASAYYSEQDRMRLASFIRVLVSGVTENPATDATAILLRDFVRDNPRLFASGSRCEVYLKAQRAIKAFMKGERLTRLYMPPSPIYTPKQL